MLADLAADRLLGRADAATMRDAERAAHQAVGLSGALERPDLAAAAAEAEQLLRGGELGLLETARLCHLAVQLEDGSRIARPPVPREPSRLGSERAVPQVIVVDDDVAYADLVEDRLRAAGAHVAVFHHGRAALEHLLGQPPAGEVVLLDVDLPGISGLGILAALVRADALRGRHVVLATVHGDDADLARTLAGDGVHHLPKPFEMARLVGVVDQLVGRA